jgi:hypothetical protein
VTTTNSQGGGATQVAVSTMDGVNAFGVIIRYQSGDFTTTQPTTTLSSAMSQQPSITSLRATTLSAAAASTSAASTSIPTHSSGLSTGAKIGIGVGVVSFLLLLVIVGFYLRGRNRYHAHKNNNKERDTSPPPQEMDARAPPQEVDAADSEVGRSLEPKSEPQVRKPYPGAVVDGRAELAGSGWRN